MYINFWYPMARIEELTDKPMKVGALGQDFVLFRDENGDAAAKRFLRDTDFTTLTSGRAQLDYK